MIVLPLPRIVIGHTMPDETCNSSTTAQLASGDREGWVTTLTVIALMLILMLLRTNTSSSKA